MSSCLSSADCGSLQVCLESLCTHKDLFPLTFLDVLTILVVFLSSIITTVAGVGGGIFFFPILMGLNLFAPSQAVAISLSTVMLLLLARYVASYKDRHPLKDRPLINYDVSVIFCPSNIVGTIFGVLLNRTLPNWLLLLLILISLGAALSETWKKAKAQKEKESSSPVLVPLQQIDHESKKPSKLLEEILNEERTHNIPLPKIKILLINMLVLAGCLLLQGSRTLPSIIGVPYCSFGFWLLLFLYIPLGALILYFSSRLLNEEYNRKVEAGYEFLRSDIKWDSASLRKSVVAGVSIGFSAAILGVGGAVITGPILIEMGFDAREATYTAAFIAVFTSIAGALQYIFAGIVRIDYMLVCFAVGLVGLYIGMHYILEYIKRTNQTYIIMQTLSLCIGVTMILVAVPGFQRSLSDYETGSLLQLRDYC